MEPYTEHKERVVEDSRFKHVMALTLDPKSEYTHGLIRCITSREGDVHIKGYTDKSVLYKVRGESLEKFIVTDTLVIHNQEKILSGLVGADAECVGLEDPDIWVDREIGLTHVYFTIPIKPLAKEEKMRIHLGHAVGKDIDSLEMTAPVLMDNGIVSAKEVSIAPQNSQGFRYNLVESRDRRPGQTYSIVRTAIAHDMGKSWQFGKVAFHPTEHNLSWIAGHASPGPLLSKSFIDVGEGRLLGVINGREADQRLKDGSVRYGIFSVGLFIYDYEDGKIEWVSPEPLIRDSHASTITFASQFVETAPGEGILYAHVDDSFVRAYTLYAEDIRKLLPPQ